jgi:cytochrome c556
MKVSTALAVAAVAMVTLAATAVMGQQDPIAARKALMKQNNDHARTLVQITRGQAPFDAAKVEEALTQWAETARVFPALFPDNSRSGQETRASPKIWESKSDFDAKAAAFGKAVADNRDKAKASLDGLKAAFALIGRTCDNCHEDYRLARR